MNELKLVTRFGLALAGVGLLAGCLAGADDFGEHRPVFTPDGEAIVFMSNRSGGDWELYVARRDGSGVRRLTEREGWDGYADVSPNGEQLVYDRDGEPYLMDLASGEARALGQFPHRIAGARFAPGGERLAAFEEVNEARDLWLLHIAQGRKLEQLTATPEMNEHDPAFSPDGRSLAFAVVLASGSALEVMDMETRERRRIVESAGYLYGVNWSPDGTRIVFNQPDGDDEDLFLVNPGGSGLQQLTDNDSGDHLGSWHPSGEAIVFTSERDGGERVYLLEVESGAVRRVDFEFGDGL